MEQVRLNTIPALLTVGPLMIGGMNDLGAAIGLTFTTATVVTQKLTNLVTACGNYEQAKQTRTTRRAAKKEALENARVYLRVIRDLLKTILGTQYSDRWTALGYHGTLTQPRTLEEVIAALNAAKNFFTNNPTMEIEGVDATAAQAQLLLDAMTTAENDVAAAQTAVESLGHVRTEKVEELRKLMRGVVRELESRLDPMDPRWTRFGLNRPGAETTPDKVEEVQVALIEPDVAAARWKPAAYANHYRVWMKIVGVDAEPVAVGSPNDTNFTIENLPLGATVEIYVSAVSGVGESLLSEKVVVVTHAQGVRADTDSRFK
jgi:hypothetical protein